jgi:DNA-binding CsgD family transcriptional regulator
MMEMLAIDRVNLRRGQFVPPLLETLVAAVQRGDDLVAAVQAVVTSFGFDSFEYGVSAAPHADKGAVYYYYSTMDAWNRRYGDLGYIEIDPRIFLTCKSSVPMVWDQASMRKFGPAVDAFLDDALAHGIASGVSFMWHGPYDMGMVVALNSKVPLNDEIRVTAINRNLPDIVMFGHYFHEMFMLPALTLGREPTPPMKPLSNRERQCLDLAARGMTTRDISVKLDISARTVQFHFAKIFDKLGAANRQEAIARGVQTGIVRGR